MVGYALCLLTRCLQASADVRRQLARIFHTSHDNLITTQGMIASFLSPAELSEKGLDGKKLFMACLDETAELGAHFACFTCFTRTKVQTLT